MRRALILYGAVTLVCFWKFLFVGWTLYDVRTLEEHLGYPAMKTGWFESHRPSSDRGDTVLSLPMLHRLYGEGLHHGELRLWNPDLFCGYPIYNNLLLHPFYPPNLILHAVLPPRIAYDFNLVLHFFFSGLAMFWLLRGSGRSDAAATVGGLLWMLIGYNTFWFSTGTFMGASVFAPLALWGLRRGLEKREFKPVCLGALAMGMVILGSHGQHALHVLIFLTLWLIVSLIADRDARVFTIKAGAIFIGGALGVGMAAILTQLDSVSNGFRVPGGDVALHYASPFLLPTYMANVALGKICYAPDGLLRSEFTIYAGVAATGLALVGAIRGFGNRWTRYLAIFAVVALLVAFIKPLAQLALQIPFLNLSMPARWVYVFGFCLTLLAAAGVDAMREDPVRSVRIAVVWSGLTLLAVAFYTKEGALIETLVGFALAAAALVSVKRSLRVSFGFCLAAIAFDLVPNFVLFNAHASPAVFDGKFPAIDSAKTSEKDPWRATGCLRVPGNGYMVPNGWELSVGSNILALYGVQAVTGYESIPPITMVDYVVAAVGVQGVMGSGRVLAMHEIDSKFLSMANMRYFFSPMVATWSAPLVGRTQSQWGEQQLVENTAVLPRAYLVSKALTAESPSEVNQTLQAETFDYRGSVVLETATPPRLSEGGGTVTWTRRDTDHIELSVDAKGDSVLVISDTEYPGWECEVDGIETPILRANLTFRAVAVAAGKHKVAMHFRPASARYGLILSALSAVVILCYCGRRKRV